MIVLVKKSEGLPAVALHQGLVSLQRIIKRRSVYIASYSAEDTWAGHEVYRELVVGVHEVPPGLNVGHVVGLADGLDLAGGAPCQHQELYRVSKKGVQLLD